MELKVGDVIKTYASEQAIILNVEDDYAVLMQNNEYVIANGYSEYEGKLVWEHGNYFDDFTSLSEYITKNSITKDSKKMLSFLIDVGKDNYDELIKGFMAYELDVENKYALDKAFEHMIRFDDCINFENSSEYIYDNVRPVINHYVKELVETIKALDPYEYMDRETKTVDELCQDYFDDIIHNRKNEIIAGIDNMMSLYREENAVEDTIKKLEKLKEDLTDDYFEPYRMSMEKAKEIEGIEEISLEQFKELVEKHYNNVERDIGQYLCHANDEWIGVDDNNLNCWVESFPDKQTAIDWLNYKFEIDEYMENPDKFSKTKESSYER